MRAGLADAPHEMRRRQNTIHRQGHYDGFD